jgi:2-polyprenyl-3-methyl-5-hydroxy-6-metoxy-1,4-benzoquinol methylase
MKIDENILNHLSGKLFRTDLTFDLSREKFAPVSREKAIAELIKNKKVIHIGCTDHIQIIKEKIKHDLWLHKLITQNASECIGIDIDKQSIDFVKSELGYNNVINGDILKDDFPVIREAEWDCAVFGEVLEHLNDPVNFLEVFRKKFGKNVKEFIVSVPTVYNKNIF